MHKMNSGPVEHFRMYPEHRCPYERDGDRITVIGKTYASFAPILPPCNCCSWNVDLAVDNPSNMFRTTRRERFTCRMLMLTQFALLVSLVVFFLSSCVTTRPHSATVLPDGTRVGVSRQHVFLRAYDAAEASAVAMDHANLAAIDSIAVKRRPAAFGSVYLTTVARHER